MINDSTPQVGTPQAAALPPMVAEWLAAPDTDDDVHFAAERWGEGLELVAERGSWRLWIGADGSSAGLHCDRRHVEDMGKGWPFLLVELAALLNNPRVRAAISRAEAEQRARILAGGDGYVARLEALPAESLDRVEQMLTGLLALRERQAAEKGGA